MLSRHDALDDRPLLGLGSGQQDGDRREAVHEGDDAHAAGDAGELLDEDADVQRPPAGSSVLLGQTDAEEPLGDEGLVDVPGKLV